MRTGIPVACLMGAAGFLAPAKAAAAPDTATDIAADQVAEPIISPEPIDFRDTLVVTLTPVTEGSTIHYTLDGSPPDSSKPKYTQPLILRATTVVKAIALKAGMVPSPVHEHAYVRIPASLGLPAADPAGGVFGDSVTVTLSPPLNAPAAALWYRLDAGALYLYQGPIVLKQSAVLKVVAKLGALSGDTAAWNFTRRLEAPAASPRGRRFPDTLRITLSPKVDGAQVRFTLDGTPPTAFSPLYSAPFLLDSTATLKAISLKEGLSTSEILTEVYELVPDSLSADPRGGDYPAGITIALRSTSPRARIWYTLDGSLPGPENARSLPYQDGVRLDTGAVLKAVAVAGMGLTLRRGQVVTETYSFIAQGLRALGPGKVLQLSERYSLSNPFPGAPSIHVEVFGAEALSLPGFRDVQFGMHVTLPAGASAFPEVKLMAPPGEERALYGLSPGGQVQFISHADTAPLPGIGTYFLGIDTLPPTITVSGEAFPGQGDSTRIVFTIQDNVSSLLLDLERSDAPDRNLSARPLANPEIFTVTLKSPAAWVPLWIKLRVDDRRNRSHFPSDPAREYQLAQRSAAPVRTPPVFRIGSRPDQPWDMVSLPFDPAGRLTLGMLKAQNAVEGLSARVHDPATGKTRLLSDKDVLESGRAIWMAGPSSISSLTLPPFQTQARLGDATYAVRLGPGWTQIANPTLVPLIWPFPRGAFDYVGSQVKGLHGFDPSLPGSGYHHADTLKPWKGYFVFNSSGKDTVIALRVSPVPVGPAPALTRKLAAPDQLLLRMVLERLPILRLGALPQAIDGLGVEDEPQPPAPGEGGPGLWSARGRARLGTDYLRFIPGALHAWTVVANGSRLGADAAAPGTRIEGLDLPDGYSAWAVSRARGLKFPISEGGRIPLVPGAVDSLDVYAGPASAVEARLAGIPVQVGAFRIAALPRPGGYLLSLSLPHAARVSFSLFSVDGKVEDRGELALAAGYYALPRAGHGNRPLAAGMRLLRLEWKGDGRSGQVIRKLALP